MEKKTLVLTSLVVLCLALLPFAASFSGTINLNRNPDGTITVDTGLPQGCGNGVLQTYLLEQCDQTDFGGQTCETYAGAGYTGSLFCKLDCTIDATACTFTNGTGNNTGGGNNPGGGGSPGGSGGSSTSSGTGGSSSTSSGSSCVPDWACSSWGECIQGEQQRVCIDKNGCGVETNRPAELFDCGGADINLSGEGTLTQEDLDEAQNQGFFSLITGAVTGAVGDNRGPFMGLILLLIVLILIYLAMRAGGAAPAAKPTKKKKVKKK